MYHFTKPQNLFNYYHFTNPLDNHIISNISEIVSNLDSVEGGVKNSQDQSSRKSQVKWIHSSDNTFDLFSHLESLIDYANKDYYNFDIINSSEAIQYTEYNELDNGEYGWHTDAFAPSAPPYRKLSLTIQLSDPSEYEGGDLQINIPQPEKNVITTVPKKKGEVIIFPSYMWHRVTPVTKGVRKSLVWWVGGSPFR